MKACEVKSLLNVTQQTLNNYIKAGKLHPFIVNKTHYEYDEKEVYALKGCTSQRINLTYSRVSLPKQKSDLESQTQRLYNYCLSNGYIITEQIEDVKSGMDFMNRKGFQQLLDLVLSYKVDKVFIENKDRLVRFGFELIQAIFKKHGTEIVVLSESENKTYEQELTDDLISIVHYYSMKSYSHRRKLNKMLSVLASEDDN